MKSFADFRKSVASAVKKKEDKDSPKTVNNALFVGSTSDLSKLLKKGVLNNKVENEEE